MNAVEKNNQFVVFSTTFSPKGEILYRCKCVNDQKYDGCYEFSENCHHNVPITPVLLVDYLQNGQFNVLQRKITCKHLSISPFVKLNELWKFDYAGKIINIPAKNVDPMFDLIRAMYQIYLLNQTLQNGVELCHGNKRLQNVKLSRCVDCNQIAVATEQSILLNTEMFFNTRLLPCATGKFHNSNCSKHELTFKFNIDQIFFTNAFDYTTNGNREEFCPTLINENEYLIDENGKFYNNMFIPPIFVFDTRLIRSKNVKNLRCTWDPIMFNDDSMLVDGELVYIFNNQTPTCKKQIFKQQNGWWVAKNLPEIERQENTWYPSLTENCVTVQDQIHQFERLAYVTLLEEQDGINFVFKTDDDKTHCVNYIARNCEQCDKIHLFLNPFNAEPEFQLKPGMKVQIAYDMLVCKNATIVKSDCKLPNATIDLEFCMKNVLENEGIWHNTHECDKITLKMCELNINTKPC